MEILVINSGSSSIKYRLVEIKDFSPKVDGIVERIGTKHITSSFCVYDENGEKKKLEEQVFIRDPAQGFKFLFNYLRNSKFLDESNVAAIGHRIVHGGEQFKNSVLITESVIDAIHEMIPLAPVHNPANLKGIKICQEAFPEVPQVAVFDTSFHQTIPAKAYRYPLAEAFYKDHKIRRYGFHGISHNYVAHRASVILDKPLASLSLISLHLGNGASASAIQGGHCVDTSMGMTPLEGLMMGTRSGDIDPAIIFYLARITELDLDEIDTLLNQKSGLFGICGSNDMREIQQRADQGDKRATLAIEMYCDRIKKYVGAYFAILGRLDVLIFTAGIGENSARVRQQVCQGLENLGIQINPEKNRASMNSETEIQSNSSPVKILVIPTDEEAEIARETLACLQEGYDS